jgi:hypothetical protein
VEGRGERKLEEPVCWLYYINKLVSQQKMYSIFLEDGYSFRATVKWLWYLASLSSYCHHTGINGSTVSDENFPEKFKSENFPFFYNDS